MAKLYCRFVSALAVHPTNSKILISAGGDDTLRIWDLTTYKCLDKRSFSLNLLKGTAEVQVEIAPPAIGRRMKRKQNKARAKRVKSSEDGFMAPEEGDENKEPESEEDAEEAEAVRIKGKTKTKKLDLAITKMAFLAGPSGRAEDGVLVLSSVGSSALLTFSAASLTTSGRSALQPQLIKFQHPVLHFATRPDSTTMFVSLDVNLPADALERAKPVQAVALSSDGRVEIVSHPALETLNVECSKEVTETEPYPSLLALYPDMALLSKDPAETGGEEA